MLVSSKKYGGDNQIRTGVQGFADLCLSPSTMSPKLLYEYTINIQNCQPGKFLSF